MQACRSALIGVAVFSAVSNVLMLTGSVFMLEVYDRVLPSRSVPTLIGLCVIAAFLFGMLAIIDIIRSRIMVRIGASLDEALSGRVYETLIKIPLRAGNRSDGLQPLRDLDNVRSFLSGLGPKHDPSVGARTGRRWLLLELQRTCSTRQQCDWRCLRPPRAFRS